MPEALFFGRSGDDVYLVDIFERRGDVYIVEASSASWGRAVHLGPSVRAVLCDGAGWADGLVKDRW